MEDYTLSMEDYRSAYQNELGLDTRRVLGIPQVTRESLFFFADEEIKSKGVAILLLDDGNKIPCHSLEELQENIDAHLNDNKK